MQLNQDKTELLWCTTGRRLRPLRTETPAINSFSVAISSSTGDLGIYIDSDLIVGFHVQQSVSRCCSALRQLRSIRRRVPTAVFQSLVFALALSQLDYCNSVLSRLPIPQSHPASAVSSKCINSVPFLPMRLSASIGNMCLDEFFFS